MAEHVALISAIIGDAAFWVGLATVAVFAAGRFNERRVDTEKDLDPPLTAHCFTSRFRFNSALVMYVLLYCALYGALIFGFSFEVFQAFFRQFFGSIVVPDKDLVVGTPAWVATLVPILISTAPWFRQRDRVLRRWLWGFAGVPQTAQAFANELISVAAQQVPPARADHLEPISLADSFRVHDVMAAIEARLRERFDDYKDFQYQHEALNRSLQDTYDTLRHSADSDADHATQIADAQAMLATALQPCEGESVREDIEGALAHLRRLLHQGDTGDEAAPVSDTPMRLAMQNLVVRRSRLIACGLLSTRGADFAARENVNDVVREMLEEGDLSTAGMGEREAPFRMRMPAFRFGYLQMLSGFVAVLMTVLVCGVAREFVLPVLGGRPLGAQIWLWLVVSPFTALAFTLPLMPAAALRYFLGDIEQRRLRQLTFEHHLLAAVVGGLAGMLLAAIVLLGLGVLILSDWLEDFELLALVPWALPMAVCSVLFMALSQLCPTRSARLNRLIDAAIFAVAGGVAAALAFAGGMIVRGTLESAADLARFGDGRVLALMAVLAVTCAVLGLTQCQSSRRGLLAHADRRRSVRATWVAVRQTPARLLRGAGIVGRRG